MLQQRAVEISEEEFAAYLTKLMIDAAAVNRKTNNYKSFQRFQCDQYITYSLILLSLLLIPYGIDFGLTKANSVTETIKMESILRTNHRLK